MQENFGENDLHNIKPPLNPELHSIEEKEVELMDRIQLLKEHIHAATLAQLERDDESGETQSSLKQTHGSFDIEAAQKEILKLEGELEELNAKAARIEHENEPPAPPDDIQ